MATLVMYGVPPKRIKLFSAKHRDLHKVWQFVPSEFKGAIRHNFERLLRPAMQEFMRAEAPDIAQADYRFAPDIQTIRAVLASRHYDRVVYYGHALSDGVTLAPLTRITGPELATVLKAAGVKHFDILGCNSFAIGSLIKLQAPGMAVGVVYGKREDDFDVDLRTMQLIGFSISPQVVHHPGSVDK